MPGQSIPRAFFMDKAFPKNMKETERGLEFLNISDNMPRHLGTIAAARRPPVPGEPKVQVTPCREDRRDETRVQTRHTYDMESSAATIANYSDAPVTHHDAGMHADDTHKYGTIYNEEIIATDDLAANDEKLLLPPSPSTKRKTSLSTPSPPTTRRILTTPLKHTTRSPLSPPSPPTTKRTPLWRGSRGGHS
jgi:hypothetical protein